MSKSQRARRAARERERQQRRLDDCRRRTTEALAAWEAQTTPEERAIRERVDAEMEARFRAWHLEHGEQLGRDLDEAAVFGRRMQQWNAEFLAYLDRRVYRRQPGLLGSGSTRRLRKKRDKAVAGMG